MDRLKITVFDDRHSYSEILSNEDMADEREYFEELQTNGANPRIEATTFERHHRSVTCPIAEIDQFNKADENCHFIFGWWEAFCQSDRVLEFMYEGNELMIKVEWVKDKINKMSRLEPNQWEYTVLTRQELVFVVFAPVEGTVLRDSSEFSMLYEAVDGAPELVENCFEISDAVTLDKIIKMGFADSNGSRAKDLLDKIDKDGIFDNEIAVAHEFGCFEDDESDETADATPKASIESLSQRENNTLAALINARESLKGTHPDPSRVLHLIDRALGWYEELNEQQIGFYCLPTTTDPIGE